MNESFLGGSDRGGIRGLFRDPECRILVQFEKKIIVDSTVNVELLAFEVGILVATDTRWVSSHSFLFKSDSQSVVIWIAGPSLVL